jgi:hypothetical protein
LADLLESFTAVAFDLGGEALEQADDLADTALELDDFGTQVLLCAPLAILVGTAIAARDAPFAGKLSIALVGVG